jgi:hypothetical protein
VLVTVVYLRQICSQNVLSDLPGINANSIGQAIAALRCPGSGAVRRSSSPGNFRDKPGHGEQLRVSRRKTLEVTTR